MDAFFCLRCFCTENHEKRVPPNKLQSIRTVQQGREYEKKRLLYRNRPTSPPRNQETGQPTTCALTGFCSSMTNSSISTASPREIICILLPRTESRFGEESGTFTGLPIVKVPPPFPVYIRTLLCYAYCKDLIAITQGLEEVVHSTIGAYAREGTK